LRDFVEGDFDAIHVYASNPDVTRFMFHGPRTIEDTRDYLDRMLASQQEEPRRTWELGVVVTTVNRLVGACDLTCDAQGDGDLGFIFSKDVWGIGYATEAAGDGPRRLRAARPDADRGHLRHRERRFRARPRKGRAAADGDAGSPQVRARHLVDVVPLRAQARELAGSTHVALIGQ